MADEMLDHDDPLHHFMFEESRALATREASQRRANAVPRPPQPRSLTVKQAWEARQAALLQTISLLEDHAGWPAMELIGDITAPPTPAAALFASASKSD